LGWVRGLSIWRAGPESARVEVAGQDGFAAANGQALMQAAVAIMLRRNLASFDLDQGHAGPDWVYNPSFVQARF